MTDSESLILSMLRDRRDGAYGSDLVRDSGGKLGRGSVYLILGRMELQGLVTSTEEPAADAASLPRTRYRAKP
jgi:DNA-binding PadR family transcriptional regulator